MRWSASERGNCKGEKAFSKFHFDQHKKKEYFRTVSYRRQDFQDREKWFWLIRNEYSKSGLLVDARTLKKVAITDSPSPKTKNVFCRAKIRELL